MLQKKRLKTRRKHNVESHCKGLRKIKQEVERPFSSCNIAAIIEGERGRGLKTIAKD